MNASRFCAEYSPLDRVADASWLTEDSSCVGLPMKARIAAMLKIRLLAVIVGFLLIIGVVAVAQPPERDISHHRHPNLAAAQDLSRKAYDKIVAAQQANEWDMDGHAQRAKELLDQGNRELKEAAEAANRHRGR